MEKRLLPARLYSKSVFRSCLSRMRGNSHVRFLGEGVAVRPSPYPPSYEGSIPFTRSTPNSGRPPICEQKSQPLCVGFFVYTGLPGPGGVPQPKPGKARTTAARAVALGPSRHRPPMARYFSSRYSSSPCREPSRPSPECLMPPNGATSEDIDPVLMPTMPYSRASPTRHTRPMSRV